MRRLRRWLLILSLPLIAIVVAYVVYKLFLVPPPKVTGTEAFVTLGREKTVTLKGENIKRIEIALVQGSKRVSILRDSPRKGEVTYELRIRPKDLGLMDAPARVIVDASSGILKKVHMEIDTVIDTVPPQMDVLDAPGVVSTGEAAVVTLQVKGASDVNLWLGEMGFRAFPVGEDRYVCIFPVPHNTGTDTTIYAAAEDDAGNRTVRSLNIRIRRKNYRVSTITIDDEFMQRVVYPLLGKMNSDDPVRDFKEVNEVWRQRDIQRLRQIGAKSTSERLWRGRFLQMQNSKVMARYGDMRYYRYRGEVISSSVHLGYDLASVKAAPVEAANRGRVVFAGTLGIYGNTVIIDHGLGVMSLYGHLSRIMVKEGEEVERGSIVGRTGATGFAGGDHLHFGILVQGVEVSPLYWWDKRWLKQRIVDRLRDVT